MVVKQDVEARIYILLFLWIKKAPIQGLYTDAGRYYSLNSIINPAGATMQDASTITGLSAAAYRWISSSRSAMLSSNAEMFNANAMYKKKL